MYKKLLSLGGNEENALFVLTNVARELDDPDSVYLYGKQYLKSWPNNKEILSLFAEAQIAMGMRKEAIVTLIKLKNLAPYDADEYTEMIAKLSAEEEMAEHFGEK